jgi:hypothetical protein
LRNGRKPHQLVVNPFHAVKMEALHTRGRCPRIFKKAFQAFGFRNQNVDLWAVVSKLFQVGDDGDFGDALLFQ